jgi:predicted MFS family arabinose efflux permease
MLESIPADQVPRSSAIYQIIVTISLSIGALIGSGLITRWGFIDTLWVSAFGRVAAAILFGVLFFHPRFKPQVPVSIYCALARYFYIYMFNNGANIP